VTVTTPSRIVHEPAHVVHGDGKRFIVVVHPKGCPPGTALFHGVCSRMGLGKW
jgi:hypothetical protein